MAYDPNCTETKAAIKAAVKTALAEQAEEHETEIQGLKDKNKELIGKLKAAKNGEGGEVDTAEVARLEGELRDTKKALRAAEKAAADAAEERDLANASAEKEKGVTKTLLTENGLTSALTKANVKPELLPGAIAMLSGKVEIKEVAGKREAQVNGKSLGDFITEWAASDEGKHYVAAPLNGGGGSNLKLPANPQGGQKKLSEMTFEERKALNEADPEKFAELTEAAKQEQRQQSRKPRRSGF